MIEDIQIKCDKDLGYQYKERDKHKLAIHVESHYDYLTYN